MIGKPIYYNPDPTFDYNNSKYANKLSVSKTVSTSITTPTQLTFPVFSYKSYKKGDRIRIIARGQYYRGYNATIKHKRSDKLCLELEAVWTTIYIDHKGVVPLSVFQYIAGIQTTEQDDKFLKTHKKRINV